MKFRTVYDAFKMNFPNPDSDDVLAFMYVYEQLEKGRNFGDIDAETEKYMEKTGYRYPPKYREELSKRDSSY